MDSPTDDPHIQDRPIDAPIIIQYPQPLSKLEERILAKGNTMALSTLALNHHPNYFECKKGMNVVLNHAYNALRLRKILLQMTKVTMPDGLLDRYPYLEPFQCWNRGQGTGYTVDTRQRAIDEQGYARINARLSGGPQKIQLHRFMIWMAEGENPINDLDCSHRCHNSWCIRPSHLIYESKKTNLNRKGCPGYLIFPLENTFKRICNHSPPCLVLTVTTSPDKPLKDLVKDVL